MVCKVFFAKNFRKKAENRETNCPECFLRTQCRANAAKTQKKGRLFTVLSRKPKSTNLSG